MFDYFYGQQAELFSFYRVPKVLFTNERFWNISADAKMLYGILLDRMNLSARNGWLDEEGRVYIIFTIDEIKESLGCGEKKAVRDDYVAKKKTLLSEEESITAKLAVLQQKLNDFSSSNKRIEQHQEAAREIRQYEGITELTPEVMKALVKRVIVYPDKHIRIEWNFSDNLIPFAPRAN